MRGCRGRLQAQERVTRDDPREQAAQRASTDNLNFLARWIVFSTIVVRDAVTTFQIDRGEERRGVSGCDSALEDTSPCFLRHATSGRRGSNSHAEGADRKCVRRNQVPEPGYL